MSCDEREGRKDSPDTPGYLPSSALWRGDAIWCGCSTPDWTPFALFPCWDLFLSNWEDVHQLPLFSLGWGWGSGGWILVRGWSRHLAPPEKDRTPEECPGLFDVDQLG